MASKLLLLPPVLFAGLVAVFAFGMMRDNPGELPSTLVGREAPPLPLTALPGIAPLTDADLRSGEVTVVNFWASWCPPCRAEHPVLLDMTAKGIRVAGVNILDKEADALGYLQRDGNPFLGVATDPQGRNRVEWGVSAPPETFIIDGDGKVLFKFTGPLLGADYENRFLPALEAALK
ncbi:DsbE family thiol:disulfide interchange protein [Pseudogemmobacter faecipullorum]|uniref:DsbE family thiol:disulfide interchange protein n=1 Tax=Pseudogemmobacter faecipullorum TaxID=2755041 RepID=A0ABS8CLA6_9RHOB|nr:DsbE family thiol:disulfide interchange protein [Pseudogemmobacter faecipullorum]MCB5409980.1 DsbE family thiol:disulfide interchange protein [Pseudogemmobacter faecipullorum]